VGPRLDLAAEIYHLRDPQKSPLVMSPETRRLLAVASSLKVRVLLTSAMAAALRRRSGAAESRTWSEPAEDDFWPFRMQSM
jgi:hypothetical protein